MDCSTTTTKQRRKKTDKEKVICAICTVHRADIIACSACGVGLCRACCEQWCVSEIAEVGRRGALRCIGRVDHNRCDQSVPFHVVEPLITKEPFEQLQRL